MRFLLLNAQHSLHTITPKTASCQHNLNTKGFPVWGNEFKSYLFSSVDNDEALSLWQWSLYHTWAVIVEYILSYFQVLHMLISHFYLPTFILMSVTVMMTLYSCTYVFYLMSLICVFRIITSLYLLNPKM
jgi:hypothetical protein